ncbi:hypothetical protein LWM68_26955 [Niabella sp. W65]|nr:hypothetical protein [Niabella sp. W65]MCH7366088.1 hypothetical protein [Niabella sp. W65]ULT41815.1 hypothetical protein KRR40_45855 [Niabella sp. I65]
MILELHSIQALWGVGTVEWNDIIRVTEKQVVSTRLLILNIRNPLKYINERKNFLSKQAFKLNYKTYGSPVVIFRVPCN